MAVVSPNEEQCIGCGSKNDKMVHTAHGGHPHPTLFRSQCVTLLVFETHLVLNLRDALITPRESEEEVAWTRAENIVTMVTRLVFVEGKQRRGNTGRGGWEAVLRGGRGGKERTVMKISGIGFKITRGWIQAEDRLFEKMDERGGRRDDKKISRGEESSIGKRWEMSWRRGWRRNMSKWFEKTTSDDCLWGGIVCQISFSFIHFFVLVRSNKASEAGRVGGGCKETRAEQRHQTQCWSVVPLMMCASCAGAMSSTMEWIKTMGYTSAASDPLPLFSAGNMWN
jgi:hypothetical protein